MKISKTLVLMLAALMLSSCIKLIPVELSEPIEAIDPSVQGTLTLSFPAASQYTEADVESLLSNKTFIDTIYRMSDPVMSDIHLTYLDTSRTLFQIKYELLQFSEDTLFKGATTDAQLGAGKMWATAFDYFNWQRENFTEFNQWNVDLGNDSEVDIYIHSPSAASMQLFDFVDVSASQDVLLNATFLDTAHAFFDSWRHAYLPLSYSEL